jgi:uncharacterized membrane protein YccF (DUF307 family)
MSWELWTIVMSITILSICLVWSVARCAQKCFHPHGAPNLKTTPLPQGPAANDP